jgi:hypothetical protein
MLDLARAKLLNVLDVLRPAIGRGIPIVGLEPSCLSVFRDEMLNLMRGGATPHLEKRRLLASSTYAAHRKHLRLMARRSKGTAENPERLTRI